MLRLILLLALCSPRASAALVPVGEYDFGPGGVTLDFLGLVPGAPVAQFYPGVGFSAGFYASNTSGQVTNRLGSLLPEFPLLISFDTPLTLFGAEVSGGVGDLLTVTLFDVFGNPLGSLAYPLSPDFQFAGLGGGGEFAFVLFENLSYGEGEIQLRNLKFTTAEVPEPPGWTSGLLGLALVLTATVTRRNHQ